VKSKNADFLEVESRMETGRAGKGEDGEKCSTGTIIVG
jgi:hypothetical protein